MVSTIIALFLLISASGIIVMLYRKSHEPGRLLAVMGATVLAGYSLAILLLMYLQLS